MSVVVVEGENVGVLGLENREDEVYVTRIEIHPDWQNRGIGSAVMQKVLDQAAVGGKAVSLHVFEINPARSLYERLGFATSGEHKDRILMKVRPTGELDRFRADRTRRAARLRVQYMGDSATELLA